MGQTSPLCTALVCSLLLGCGRTEVDGGSVVGAGGVDQPNASSGEPNIAGQTSLGKFPRGGASATPTAGRANTGGTDGTPTSGSGSGGVANGGMTSGGEASGGSEVDGGFPAGGEGGSAEEQPPWIQVGHDLSATYAYAIAAAPTEVGVVYAGNASGGGVFRTTDSGASWTSVSNGLDDDQVRTLAVDPFDAKNVWVGTPSGIYGSHDSGAHWARVDIGGAAFPFGWSITLDPSKRGRIYVVLNPDTQVSPQWSAAFVSDDGGLSWQKLGMPGNFRGIEVGIDPSDSAHLFMGTYGQGVFESHDAGKSFQQMPNLPTPNPRDTYEVVYEPKGNVLCASVTDGMASSTDGGVTWAHHKGLFVSEINLLPGPIFYMSGNSGIYRSTNCSDWTNVDPTMTYRVSVDAAGAVYAASVGWVDARGVRRSPNGVDPFVNVNSGITNADVRGLALDESTPGHLYVSANYQDLYRSTDGADSFVSANGDIGHRGTTAFPDVLLYVDHTLFGYPRTTAGRIFRSEDEGASWSDAQVYLPDKLHGLIGGLLASPDYATDNTLYLGVSANHGISLCLEQSVDRGDTFDARGECDFTTLNVIWDKQHAGWMWAIGLKTVSVNVTAQGLYLSQDSGLTWTSVALPIPGPYGLLAASTTPAGETIYITADAQGLLRSDDAGATWQLVSKPPGARYTALAIDPTDAKTVYLAGSPSWQKTSLGERGLFKSRDGGVTWTHADRGMIPGVVQTLAIEPQNPQVLYAGMQSGGFYRTRSGGE